MSSLFLFCPRLEICIEASFVELLEGLWSKCIACIGEQKLQVWENNGKELTVLLGSIKNMVFLPNCVELGSCRKSVLESSRHKIQFLLCPFWAVCYPLTQC